MEMASKVDFEKAKKMLIFDEGKKTRPYKCTAGKTTIGIGRNLDDVGISDATIDLMFKEDLERAASICENIFGLEQWNRWSDARRLGWTNFAFQLGRSRMLGFRNTLKAAIAEDWADTERRLRESLWAKQTPNRAERVIAMIVDEKFPYA